MYQSLGMPNRRFEEGKQLVVVVGEDVNRDGVNCQLYSGWRQGEW